MAIIRSLMPARTSTAPTRNLTDQQKAANKLQNSRESKQRAAAAERARKLSAGEKARSESSEGVDPQYYYGKEKGLKLTLLCTAAAVYTDAELEQLDRVAQDRLDSVCAHKHVKQIRCDSPAWDEWGMRYVTKSEREKDPSKEDFIGSKLAPIFNELIGNGHSLSSVIVRLFLYMTLDHLELTCHRRAM